VERKIKLMSNPPTWIHAILLFQFVYIVYLIHRTAREGTKDRNVCYLNIIMTLTFVMLFGTGISIISVDNYKRDLSLIGHGHYVTKDGYKTFELFDIDKEGRLCYTPDSNKVYSLPR